MSRHEHHPRPCQHVTLCHLDAVRLDGLEALIASLPAGINAMVGE